MKRVTLIWMFVGAAIVALVAWVASNTYWADMKVPMPPKGEARTNPFYAVQRFAEALGARTAWDRLLTIPPTDSVIVLSSWHWSLSAGRRQALERWVEAGGRLIVDTTVVGDLEVFERWSGIVTDYPELDATAAPAIRDQQMCRLYDEELNEAPHPDAPASTYWLCDLDGVSFLASSRPVLWALRDRSGIQAARVSVGRGRVTVINAAPFRERSVFNGDHGRLFVAATEMRRGDDIHFLSEDDHPSLLALVWQYGAPVVVLSLVLIGLVIWRRTVRFGPLKAPSDAARRSLAEQLRGTGQFTLRHGGGDALHAASVRALDEAAERRIPAYAQLTAKERATALARLTGMEWKTLARAVHRTGGHRLHELRNTIAVLEAARRQVGLGHSRSSHGTH
jgi:hypothetical protein